MWQRKKPRVIVKLLLLLMMMMMMMMMMMTTVRAVHESRMVNVTQDYLAGGARNDGGNK